MRMRSEYEIPCVCGKTFRSHERITVCPSCKRVFDIQFPQWMPPSAMSKLCQRITDEQAQEKEAA